MPLYDLHNHLSSTEHPRAFAEELTALGVMGSLSCTVTPDDYLSARQMLDGVSGVRVALGLHPWWVADGSVTEQTLEQFEALAVDASYIGELGVDLTARAADAIDRQQKFLDEALRMTQATARLYSFHSSHAAGILLDLLERYALPRRCPCILHWFNGTSQELTRARVLGCYFSINGRMLATKRGRAYVKAIAKDRLLLETDGPYERHGLTTSETFASDLTSTLTTLETLRDEPLAPRIAATSTRLLELTFDGPR